VVEALTQGGPAEKIGKLKMGDVLQTIDGSPVANMTDRMPRPRPRSLRRRDTIVPLLAIADGMLCLTPAAAFLFVPICPLFRRRAGEESSGPPGE